MKIKKYIYAAIALIFLVFFIYFVNFYLVLGYEISKDPSVWSDIGGYAGGILGPLLSFLSIVLLIKSLALQHEANTTLKDQLKNNSKTEKLRSFESLFFNMIETQRKMFDTFKVQLDTGEELVVFEGAKSVLEIEDVVSSVKNNGGSDQQVKSFLEDLDSDDQIFGLIRSFYIIVLMVSEKLSESEGFCLEERKSHYKALVNFTSFYQLRLVMICVQFMDFESTKYLRSSTEFREVIEELGMGIELY